MSELATFFAQMKPFLRGETDAGEVQAALGAASPEHGLRFYAVLMERNAFKAMRDLHPSLPAAADRHRPGLWAELVRAFVRERPHGGRHPDAVGEGFAAWLGARPGVPVLLTELADFHAAQLTAATAPDPDDDDDGWDRTLHVRLYTHPVSAIAAALIADPKTAHMPAPALTPIVVYRHRQQGGVRISFPDPAALVALARRAGTEVPTAFADVPGAAVDAARARLVAQGVLPRTDRPQRKDIVT